MHPPSPPQPAAVGAAVECGGWGGQQGPRRAGAAGAVQALPLADLFTRMRMLVQGQGSPLQPLLLLMLLLLHHHQQQLLPLLLQVVTGAPIAAAAAAKDPTAPAPEVPSSPFTTLKYKAFSVRIYGLRSLSLPLWFHRRLLPIALGFSRPHVNQYLQLTARTFRLEAAGQCGWCCLCRLRCSLQCCCCSRGHLSLRMTPIKSPRFVARGLNHASNFGLSL